MTMRKAKLDPLDEQTGELRRRVAAVQSALKKRRLDAMLVYDRHNTFYLTGLRCSLSFLLITPREAVLLLDGRYIEAGRSGIAHCEVRLLKEQRKSIAQWGREFGLRRVGFEGTTDWNTLSKWREFMPAVEWLEAGEVISRLRLIKSAAEARHIERSARLNDQVYADVLSAVRAGATEIDLRNQLRQRADAVGAEAQAFDAIIAAGAMSSRPHYEPQARPLDNNALLLIDMGLLVEGYCSDMTRVVGLGKPKARLRSIYEAVLAAQQKALAAVGPGVPCADLDAIAREELRRRKMAQYFTHGLGHGVGLEIHEAPTLNARSQEVLRPGMVVTIEPGVYLPGVGGVRIEDLVLVTRSGHKVLSHTPKLWRALELA